MGDVPSRLQRSLRFKDHSEESKGKEKEKIKRKGKEKKAQHWENLKEERRRNISN